jgi:hypothetical protein
MTITNICLVLSFLFVTISFWVKSRRTSVELFLLILLMFSGFSGFFTFIVLLLSTYFKFLRGDYIPNFIDLVIVLLLEAFAFGVANFYVGKGIKVNPKRLLLIISYLIMGIGVLNIFSKIVFSK